MIFFTADAHFNHGNIIKYCNRPFNSIEKMNSTIIRNWNERIKESYTVYHLGDFCFKGGIDGHQKASYWEDQLKGKIVFLKGNHDKNNGVGTHLIAGILHIDNKVIMICHHPPHRKEEIPEFCDYVFCGHVHEKWKIKHLEDCNIPIVNVGVDVWDFRPVTYHEIKGFIYKDKKNGHRGLLTDKV